MLSFMQGYLKVPDPSVQLTVCIAFGPLLIRWREKKRALSASADHCLNVNAVIGINVADRNSNGFCFRGAEGFTKSHGTRVWSHP
jgi:hypothetical protein